MSIIERINKLGVDLSVLNKRKDIAKTEEHSEIEAAMKKIQTEIFKLAYSDWIGSVVTSNRVRDDNDDYQIPEVDEKDQDEFQTAQIQKEEMKDDEEEFGGGKRNRPARAVKKYRGRIVIGNGSYNIINTPIVTGAIEDLYIDEVLKAIGLGLTESYAPSTQFYDHEKRGKLSGYIYHNYKKRWNTFYKNAIDVVKQFGLTTHDNRYMDDRSGGNPAQFKAHYRTGYEKFTNDNTGKEEEREKLKEKVRGYSYDGTQKNEKGEDGREFADVMYDVEKYEDDSDHIADPRLFASSRSVERIIIAREEREYYDRFFVKTLAELFRYFGRREKMYSVYHSAFTLQCISLSELDFQSEKERRAKLRTNKSGDVTGKDLKDDSPWRRVEDWSEDTSVESNEERNDQTLKELDADFGTIDRDDPNNEGGPHVQMFMRIASSLKPVLRIPLVVDLKGEDDGYYESFHHFYAAFRRKNVYRTKNVTNKMLSKCIENALKSQKALGQKTKEKLLKEVSEQVLNRMEIPLLVEDLRAYLQKNDSSLEDAAIISNWLQNLSRNTHQESSSNDLSKALKKYSENNASRVLLELMQHHLEYILNADFAKQLRLKEERKKWICRILATIDSDVLWKQVEDYISAENIKNVGGEPLIIRHETFKKWYLLNTNDRSSLYKYHPSDSLNANFMELVLDQIRDLERELAFKSSLRQVLFKRLKDQVNIKSRLVILKKHLDEYYREHNITDESGKIPTFTIPSLSRWLGLEENSTKMNFKSFMQEIRTKVEERIRREEEMSSLWF